MSKFGALWPGTFSPSVSTLILWSPSPFAPLYKKRISQCASAQQRSFFFTRNQFRGKLFLQRDSAIIYIRSGKEQWGASWKNTFHEAYYRRMAEAPAFSQEVELYPPYFLLPVFRPIHFINAVIRTQNLSLGVRKFATVKKVKRLSYISAIYYIILLLSSCRI